MVGAVTGVSVGMFVGDSVVAISVGTAEGAVVVGLAVAAHAWLSYG